MAPGTLREFASSQRRINLIIWVAFAWSIALLTGVAYYAAEIAPKLAAADPSAIRNLADDGLGVIKIVCTLTAIALCFASVLVRRALASRKPAVGVAVPAAVAALPSDEQSAALAIQSRTFANIIGWALGESVLLSGLALVVLAREFRYILPFLGASLILHFIAFPARDE